MNSATETVIETATLLATRALSTLPPGRRGRVVDHMTRGGTRNRLLEMGLTRGTMVEVVRVAPLGDPIELAVRGYRLSVRKAEAAGVLVDDA